MLLSASRPARQLQRGFTLIELMITLVVIAILAAVVYPSYTRSVQRGRRSDAVQALAMLQQAQERWRAQNTSYATESVRGTDWPNGLGQQATSSGGYYTIAISTGASAPSGTDYWVTATAVSTKSQANDSGCSTLTVHVTNGAATNTPATCWSN